MKNVRDITTIITQQREEAIRVFCHSPSERLIRVGILLVDLLILEDLLRKEKTTDVTDTAEIESGLALVVADFGISTVAEEDLNTLSRTSPGSLVERSLATLVLDSDIGTT